jgi:hypothetical protein
VPKKPRQAHIPQQAKRRRARRIAATSALPASSVAAPAGEALPESEPIFADPPALSEPAFLGTGPVATPRARRRIDQVRAPQEAVFARNVPGQLPTFERAYIVRELRQIAFTSGSLLALIVALTLILR